MVSLIYYSVLNGKPVDKFKTLFLRKLLHSYKLISAIKINPQLSQLTTLVNM